MNRWRLAAPGVLLAGALAVASCGQTQDGAGLAPGGAPGVEVAGPVPVRATLGPPAPAVTLGPPAPAAPGAVADGGIPPGPDGDAFYLPPDPLPGRRPGDLVWATEVGPVRGGTWWRVLYRSQGVRGTPVAVSGLVVVPDGDPPPGGWPVLAWAHGTTGTADACAPSRESLPLVPALDELLAAGYVVAATDYEGLGTPGPHPYLVGASQGRSVLDAARAARALTGGRSSSQVLVWGHSQGGQAALWAGELAARYAPELDVRGVVAVAPTAELGDRVGGPEGIDATWWLAGLAVSFAHGMAAADPTLGLADLLTAEALASIDLLEQECIWAVSGAFAPLAGRVFRPDPAPRWLEAIAANDAGGQPSSAPVLVLQGAGDTIVPPASTRTYVDHACAAGTTVELWSFAEDDHTTVLSDRVAPTLAWFADRLAGVVPGTSCGAT